MLRYVFRVRDLVHGTILFTEQERRIIDHPLFQRLRQVRQNDAAFTVYPSLNTSRFEHVLGACRVAGMMAEHLTLSPQWESYSRELTKQTGIKSKKGEGTLEEKFIELCRFYALLHDIGHLPLSHLFEMGVEGYEKSKSPEVSSLKIVEEWTGVTGSKSLHEAVGAVIARRIVQDLRLTKPTRDALLILMTEKNLPFRDPLSVVQRLIASDIDADRIDFVRRDGISAGGEYGNYDIKRLCDSVFIEQDEGGWLVGFSEKALTSMEALLLDRYRIYEWIHFHHRVVAMKMLVRFLIQKALEKDLIRKEHFNPADVDEFALHDDVWLWHVLRNMEADDETTRIIQGAVFYREKKHTLNLWKTRPAYHALRGEVEDKTQLRGFKIEKQDAYRAFLLNRMGVHALKFEIEFTPVSKRRIRLYSEEEKQLTDKDLKDVSKLVAGLDAIWEDEPQEFILLVGKNARAREKHLKERWVDLTAEWIQNPTLW